MPLKHAGDASLVVFVENLVRQPPARQQQPKNTRQRQSARRAALSGQGASNSALDETIIGLLMY